MEEFLNQKIFFVPFKRDEKANKSKNHGAFFNSFFCSHSIEDLLGYREETKKTKGERRIKTEKKRE